MADEASFRQVQRRFSAHLRDPANQPPPEGLDPARLAIYRDAVFANIEALLADNFPLLRRYFDEAAWHALVREFMLQHRSREMRFVRYPLQFIDWLGQGPACTVALPFLGQLADFEWRETDVCGDPMAIPETGFEPQGDMLAGAPVVNPVHRVVRYDWAVHLLGEGPGEDDAAEAPQARACTLIVFRNPAQRFDCVELNPVTARLFELIAENAQASGREHLTRIAWELKHPDADAVIAGGLEILERMRARGLVLGTRQALARP